MLVGDVERLIDEEKIVACKLDELQVVTIKKAMLSDKYGIYPHYVKLDNELKDKVIFLYKVDDNHYIEYYSKKTILVINKSYSETKLGEKSNFNSLINDYETKYRDCPLILFKNGLIKINAKIKNSFSKNSDLSNSLEKLFEEAQDNLSKQYEKAVLDNKKEAYTNKVFEELKGKKAFIVRISDLQNVRIDQNDDNNEFKYYFKRENRTIFTTLETTNFTILTEISSPLYEEYYNKTKMIVVPLISEQEEKANNILKDSLGCPRSFNTFCTEFDFFLAYPLIAARKFQEYNSDTMHLIGDNFDKEVEIKEIITKIEEEARTKLEEDNKKIEKKDEHDAYVDNVLIDIALSLRKNTED